MHENIRGHASQIKAFDTNTCFGSRRHGQCIYCLCVLARSLIHTDPNTFMDAHKFAVSIVRKVSCCAVLYCIPTISTTCIHRPLLFRNATAVERTYAVMHPLLILRTFCHHSEHPIHSQVLHQHPRIFRIISSFIIQSRMHNGPPYGHLK